MKMPIVVFMLCFLFSCGDARMNFEGGEVSQSAPAIAAVAKEEVATRAFDVQTANVQVVADRKLIKTGFLNIAVEDVRQTKSQIDRVCKEYNAYVSSETQSSYRERFEYNQVIRIPAAHFDSFVNKIEALGVEVKHKNIETSDVTEEFIDKEARIKTKKELESRYREILKQAKEVSDILSIEAQLNHVRADIESMEGRLNYLRNQVDHSTLTLTFYEAIGIESGFGSKTVAALGNGWDMLLIFLIGLVNVWPFLLLISGIVYAGYRRMRFRRMKTAPGV